MRFYYPYHILYTWCYVFTWVHMSDFRECHVEKHFQMLLKHMITHRSHAEWMWISIRDNVTSFKGFKVKVDSQMLTFKNLNWDLNKCRCDNLYSQYFGEKDFGQKELFQQNQWSLSHWEIQCSSGRRLIPQGQSIWIPSLCFHQSLNESPVLPQTSSKTCSDFLWVCGEGKWALITPRRLCLVFSKLHKHATICSLLTKFCFLEHSYNRMHAVGKIATQRWVWRWGNKRHLKRIKCWGDRDLKMLQCVLVNSTQVRLHQEEL